MQGNNSLHIGYSPKKMSAEYGVNIYFDNKADELQRIQYNATVQYCGKFGEQTSVFHLHKDNIVLNGNRADDNSYQLAVACSKVFYPIVALTDRMGLITSIRTDVMLKRWIANKDSLKYFVGEEAERYISETENALKNEEKVKLLIDRDMFFSHFFKLIYGFQRESADILFELALPVIPFDAPVKYACTQNVNYQSLADEESEYYLVNQKGKLIDELKVEKVAPFRFTGEAMNNKNVDGYFEAEYEIHRESHFIESLICKYVLKVEDEVLKETAMTVYHLHEKTVMPANDDDLKNIQLHNEKMNRSFGAKVFDFFFD